LDSARFDRSSAEQALLERAEAVSSAHPRPEGRPFDAAELRSIFRELAPTGYLGSTLPREAGGLGLGALEFSALVEGLSPDLCLLGNHSVQRYLGAFATDAQRRRHLPPLLEGTGIGAISMTEAGAGSDLQSMRTTARRAGRAYLIDGEKTWVTHGLAADLFVVLVRAEGGLTRLLVPGDASGLRRVPMHTVGLRHLGFARLVFERCEVPEDWRLGGEGDGLKGAKAAFPIARALAALQAVRIARAVLDIACEYADGRAVAHGMLAGSALVQEGLARLLARCESARLLALRVICRLEAADAVPMASAAKAMAGELALDACRWVEDLLGSASLHDGHRLHTLAADARMMAVVDGTSVLNHLVLGRRVLGPGAGSQ
jgi:alkylation response protein AidB-like acyl-CoA dehydrogenase